MLNPSEETPFKKLEEENEYEEEEEFVGDWEMIPAKAFLFFPSGKLFRNHRIVNKNWGQGETVEENLRE